MEIKILVADDDELFRELLCDILKKEGYSTVVACDGQQALDIYFSSNDISMLLLDVMMPIYDGWEVLKEIREHSDVPVIMLTALGDENNEVKGFNIGADDYIAKPFKFKSFVARVNKIARKINSDKNNCIDIGKIRIDQECRKVFVAENEIYLNKKEYKLLNYLVKNKGVVLTREQILDNVWGYDFDGDIRTIDTHIKMIRAKLLECSNYLRTIRGIGYMFVTENE